MKPLRTRLSPRQTLLCIGVLLFLSCSLPFLSSPSLHQRPQDESSSSNGAISMTSVGPSAFASHLYRQSNDDNDAAACRPMGIHLAQASNVGQGGLVSMTVSLHLDYQACRDAVPTVVYGQGVWDKKKAKAKEALQFNFTSEESNGIFQSPWIWHVPLADVKAGPQRYWYKIVVHQGQRATAWTDAFYFYTPPMPQSPTALALVGDLGQTENSTKTMHHIWRAASTQAGYNQHFVTQVIIAGDLSYADSDPHRWTSWFDIMEPLLRILPLSVAAGNHEIECDMVTNRPFQPYEHYFRMPNRMAESDILPIDDDYRKTLWNHSCSAPSQFQGHYDYGNAFYSYEHGLAKIIVLGSYSNSTVGSAQYEWLADELDNFDRAVTPWLIVTFHAPLYTSFLGHVNESEALLMRHAMEPLFLASGVNFVVSGHDHAYMRTHPMYQEAINPMGPVYFTLGAAGNREQHSRGYLNPDPEEWVAKRDISDYGYGHLFMPNATHARFHWVRDGVSDMGVIDHVWLTNPHVAKASTIL